LRDAARSEYARRKQERKDQLAATRAEKSRPNDAEPEAGDDEYSQTVPPARPELPPALSKFRTTSSLWGSKAVDKGKQATGSFKGLVSSLTSKAKEGKENS
jgi:hypothetical protein